MTNYKIQIPKSKLIIALLLILMVSANTVFSEGIDFKRAVAEIQEAESAENALKIFEEALRRCEVYDDYEGFAYEIKETLAKDPAVENGDVLFYGIAAARVEQLNALTKDNDIESVRLYMKVGEGYFNEALMSLNKVSDITKSGDLILNTAFLRFLIAREKFQPGRAEALFNDIGEKIADLNDRHEADKYKLESMVGKLEEKGLSDYALKLKMLYAKKIGGEGAYEVAKTIKDEAGIFFKKGDYEKANMLYRRYIELGQEVFDRSRMAEETIDIADNYFDKGQHKEAINIYNIYMETYGEHPAIDYCTYRIAKSLYFSKNYVEATSRFNTFLETYPESDWFDAAFRNISRIYFESGTAKRAIKDLQSLVKRYSERPIRSYAELLTGILYYGSEDYKNALKSFRKVYKGSPYFYAADTLMKDIEDIKKGNPPAFSFASEDTYRMWNPYTSIEASVEASETSVEPEGRVSLNLYLLQDADKFAEYLYDKEDLSRLPRKIGDGKENDLFSLQWSCPDGGKFLKDEQLPEVVWQAPGSPGTYKVSVHVEDLGLVRPPDEGTRKDEDAKDLTAEITVGR